MLAEVDALLQAANRYGCNRYGHRGNCPKARSGGSSEKKTKSGSDSKKNDGSPDASEKKGEKDKSRFYNEAAKYPEAAREIIRTIAWDPEWWFDVEDGKDPVEYFKDYDLNVPDDDLRRLYHQITSQTDASDFRGAGLKRLLEMY